jgi:hypothetical protein
VFATYYFFLARLIFKSKLGGGTLEAEVFHSLRLMANLTILGWLENYFTIRNGLAYFDGEKLFIGLVSVLLLIQT